MIKLAIQATTIESENDPHGPRNQYVDDEADHSIIIEYIIDYIKAMTMRARTTLIGLATNTWTTRLIIVY
jgi:hypothetical protein